MSNREDKNMPDRAEREPIDDLLALDRKLVLKAANERIAGGMYARIARAHAERRLLVPARWRWALAAAAAACVALAVVRFAAPAKNGPDVRPPDSRAGQTESAAPLHPPVDAQIAEKIAGKKPVKPVRSAPRVQGVIARQIVPRQAIFPMQTAPTEQERLLMQLAASQPKELLAAAEAMADIKKHENQQRIDFDQWVQQKGETQ